MYMNFGDEKVKTAIVMHLNFAISSVNAVLPERGAPGPLASDIDKMVVEIRESQRSALMVQVLAFTLALDSRLRNSLYGISPEKTKVPENLTFEDLVL